MKNLSLTSLFFVFSFSTIQSQAKLEWETRFTGINPVGNDIGNVITVNNDGFIYVVGKTAGLSNFDYITIKYSSEGDTIWTRTFNGAGNGDDEILAIEIDFQGNVYVTGSSMGGGTLPDIVTLKYDSNGNLLFQKVYNNSALEEIGYDIVLDFFGNIYIGGSSQGNSIVIKYDNNGNFIWVRTYDSGACNHILLNNNNNLVIGISRGLQYPYDLYEISPVNGNQIYKYNTNMNTNAQEHGIIDRILLDISDNIFVLATADNLVNNIDPVIGNIAKYNRGIGTEAWEENITDTRVWGRDAVIDDSLNVYFLLERLNSNIRKLYLVKFNSSGTELWEKEYYESSIIQEFPVNIIIGKHSENISKLFATSYTSSGKLKILTFNRFNGELLNTEIVNCSANQTLGTNSAISDKCDNIYITGFSSCNNTGQDIKTIKFSTAILPIITVTGPNPICEGSSIMLSTTTCTGCTYLWSTGETTSSISVSPIVTTDYTVEVKFPSDCVLTSLEKKIMVNPLLTPGVSINAASPSICKGQNVIFTANPVNGGVNPSFQWYLNSVLQNGNTSTFSISTLNDGDVISSTMTSNANCLTTNMAVSNSVTMTVFELLPTGITITSSVDTICQEESVTFLATPSNGGASPTYQWFVDGVLQSNQSGSSFTTTLNQSATIYSKMTSNAVCPDPSIVSSESIFIAVKPNLTPQLTISASLNEICENVNVIFTASQMNGGTNPVFQWFVNGVLQPNHNATFSGNNFTNGANISSTMTTGEVCTTQANATSNIISLTVHPKVIPTIEIVSDLTSVCAGKSVSISSSITNGGNAPSYQWYVDNILQSENGNTFSTSDLLNGTEVFGILTSNAICLDQTSAMSNAISFTVHTLPEVQIIPDGPTTFCQGNSVQLQANDAESYLWSSGSATTQLIDVSNSGNYTVTVTDVNGCTAISSIALTEIPLPSSNITLSGSTTFCQGGSVTLTVDGAPEYKWSTDETSQSINVIKNGDYVVTVTNENGCSAISLPTTIIVNPLPVALIVPDGPTTFCLGENVILTASEAQSYVWNLGQTTRSVDISSSGVNVVTVTDANGCSAISSDILVAVNPLITPAVTILSSDNAICAGANVTFTSTATNGGSMPSYQWYINGNLQVDDGPVFTTNTLMNNEQVLCRMTSNAECLTQSLVQSNIISIAVNPLLTPEVSISTLATSVLACQEVTFTPTPTNGGVSPTYQWFLNGNSVSSNPSFSTSDLINGDQVSCIMTSSATCKTTPTATSNTLTMSVSQLPQPTITISEDTISSVNYKDALYGYIWYYNGTVVSASPFINCSQYGNGSYYLVINYNGCTVTSNTKDILCTVPTKDIDNKNSFIVYPNPTNNIIHISGINISSSEFRIVAYNLLGQKLEEKSILSSNDILNSYLDMSSYASGIYTIVVYGEAYRQVFKVHKIE